MTPDLDPRAERRRTRDGEGARWDVIRSEVIERDEYTCQRCGARHETAPESGLEVHNTAALRSSSLDELERLVTLCRPCHATLHSDDPAYGDLSADAPMFPRPEAPASVATMRSDRQHVCQRCQYVASEAGELAACTREGQQYVLCKPCAGALLEAGYDPESFEAAGGIDADALRERAGEAPVRPALLASRAVRADRRPRTRTERVVHDTPLRYLLNPIGLTLLFVVAGVAFSVFAL